MMLHHTTGGFMKLRSRDGMGGLKRAPVHVEPNGSYFNTVIPKYLLLVVVIYLPLRILDWPGWIAWPAANLYLLWEFTRERAGHIELGQSWNVLLKERMEHERRQHERRLKKQQQPPAE